MPRNIGFRPGLYNLLFQSYQILQFCALDLWNPRQLQEGGRKHKCQRRADYSEGSRSQGRKERGASGLQGQGH